MRTEDIKSVYFIGVGGIGMSAIARFFLNKGIPVAGYDRVSTPLIQTMQSEGADIHFEDEPALIPEQFRDKEHTLVIYTPAIPNEHKELN